MGKCEVWKLLPGRRDNWSCFMVLLIKSADSSQIHVGINVLRFLAQIGARGIKRLGDIAHPEIDQSEIVGVPRRIVRAQSHGGLQGRDGFRWLACVYAHS